MKKILTPILIGILCLSILSMFAPKTQAVGLPVGYWKFDEGSGMTAFDSSGNGNAGTLMNGPQWIDGISIKALQFDGSNDYVRILHSSSLDISGNEISVEFWMKLTNGWHPDPGASYTYDQILYDKGDAYTSAMIKSTGALRFNIPYVPPYPETNKNSWDANTWYHIAEVFDGSQIRIYVNGVLDKAETVIGSVSRSSINLAIGSHCYGGSHFFNGAIDDFAIFNYARTAEEISNDYVSQMAPRAWKDDTSFGLENSRLFLHGLAATGNYRWFFDYLIFKDTGTMWYQPWGELAMLVYPNFQWAGTITTDFQVNAFTESDKAYLKYSITSGNLREELTYTIYTGQPYIYVTLSLTNIGSTVENTCAGVQFTTWIAGDYANDFYYVPGHGQGQFTGGTGNINYPDATETWVAEWDQNKGEGCGILSTKGFAPNNAISEDFGYGEGFKYISPNFDLAPGQISITYDCYLYFFTGTGWQKTKDLYDSLRVPTKWAVVLGVNEYSDPKQNGKGGPVNSAKDMYDLLVSKFGFPSTNVHLRTDTVGNSGDDIREADIKYELGWLAEKVHPGDTAVFYYAGHGWQGSGGEEYLVPHDTEKGIPDMVFVEYINKIHTEKLLVILDMSYSGGFITDGQNLWQGIRGIIPRWTDLAEKTPSGRIVLTACAENVGPGKLRDAKEQRSWHYDTGWRFEMVFTHYLVMGFIGYADSNRDEKVTVEEAFNFARPRAFYSQTPLMYDGYPAYGSSGDFYLG